MSHLVDDTSSPRPAPSSLYALRIELAELDRDLQRHRHRGRPLRVSVLSAYGEAIAARRLRLAEAQTSDPALIARSS